MLLLSCFWKQAPYGPHGSRRSLARWMTMSHLENDRSWSVTEDLCYSLNNQEGEIFPAAHVKFSKGGRKAEILTLFFLLFTY